MSPGATLMETIAGFVETVDREPLPAGVVAHATDALTDALGCGIAGSREPLAASMRTALDLDGASDTGSVLLGGGRSGAAGSAAMFNGAAIHALDFDDTNHPAYSHPSSHLLPVLLAAACGGAEMTGRRAVAAYVAGLEVEARLGETLNMEHYLHGWHATGTLGTLAAAVTAAVAHRLSTEQTYAALGIAASMASGLRANFGTMTKPLHAGLAARNGVESARLAAAGFTASDQALDGPFGYLDVFSESALSGLDLSSWRSLGSEWATMSPYGLALKLYPSCGATHPAIEAALLLHGELADRSIGTVEVGTTRHWERVLIHPRPTTGLQGKFSMHHCVAVALATGAVTRTSFEDRAVRDPAVRAVRDRVAVGVHPELADNTEWAAEVAVATADGRTHRRRIELAKGKRDRWPARDELRAKFVDCATPTLSEDRAGELFALAQQLPALTDLGELVARIAEGRT